MKASDSEEPGAGKLHAGICAGGVRQRASLPRKALGQRYYSTDLARWMSRDPIGYVGGKNLYVFVENTPPNRIDLLGMLPGLYICSDAGEPDVLDPQWASLGYVPSGVNIPTGGAGGFSVDALKVRWIRGFKRKYICCDCTVKWADGVRGYAKTMTQDAPYFFYGPPGPWTPIPTGATLAEWFFNTAGAAITWWQSPWPDTANSINSFIQNNAPGVSQLGDIVKKPKAPWTWCWW